MTSIDGYAATFPIGESKKEFFTVYPLSFHSLCLMLVNIIIRLDRKTENDLQYIKNSHKKRRQTAFYRSCRPFLIIIILFCEQAL